MRVPGGLHRSKLHRSPKEAEIFWTVKECFLEEVDFEGSIWYGQAEKEVHTDLASLEGKHRAREP